VQDPLQSTPPSSPFWTPSAQLGAVQALQAPPQSTAVSPPFRAPSEQVTAASGTAKCVAPPACAASAVHAALRSPSGQGAPHPLGPRRPHDCHACARGASAKFQR
jgi:hypothetical protein